MKTYRTWLVVAVVVCALIAGFAVWRYRHAEPEHAGRKASAWLMDIDGGGADKPAHREAVVAFEAMGARAVPMLIRRLEQNPSKLEKRIVELAARWSVTKALFPDMTGQDAKAAYALFVIGANAQEAIPSLKAVVASNSPPACWSARAALVRLNQEPMSKVLDDLAMPVNSESWMEAVKVVTILGPEAKAAIPLLVNASVMAEVRDFGIGHGIPRVSTALFEASSKHQCCRASRDTV